MKATNRANVFFTIYNLLNFQSTALFRGVIAILPDQNIKSRGGLIPSKTDLAWGFGGFLHELAF
jgi:hypothetical protein